MKTTKALVSIVIPTYNRAHVIEKTLNSVIAQTYTNWECIIVDDGSTDNTIKAIEPYLKKDKRFRFYSRPNNIKKGPSTCRNYGYEQSEGEYVQWFDSDDLMHPDKLRLKLEYAFKYEADVIVDDHSESDDFSEEQNISVDCFTSKDFYIDFLLGKKPIITNDVMVKSIRIGNNRFDENLFKGEEHEFYSRVFQQKLTFCFMDVALTCYRISPDSISISPNQVESLIYLSKKLQKAHSTNPLIVKRAKRQGRKTYKWLIKKNKIKLLIKNFMFFRKSYDKSLFTFIVFFCYNIITKKGFDVMRKKRK